MQTENKIPNVCPRCLEAQKLLDYLKTKHPESVGQIDSLKNDIEWLRVQQVRIKNVAVKALRRRNEHFETLMQLGRHLRRRK